MAKDYTLETSEEEHERAVSAATSPDAEMGPADPSATSPKPPGRYDFELPSDIAVSDLLAVQIADCARIVRSLSDQAIDRRLDDLERMRTVQALSDVVTASGDLAECIDRFHGGAGWRGEPARKKSRKS